MYCIFITENKAAILRKTGRRRDGRFSFAPVERGAENVPEQTPFRGARNRKNMIDGYTRVCGVIGNPVEHTMSPAIHNTISNELGENLAYLPFHVPDGQVGQAVKGAFALNLLGINVTVPYKSQVLPFLDEIDPLAESIGAVNTLVRTERGFKGYNTDMPGLYRAMCEDGVTLSGENVLILGAGGVARAVALLCARKEVRRLRILNRTLAKASLIADEVNRLAGGMLAEAMELAEYDTLPEEERYLVIQATNVGMFPNTENVIIEDAAFYRRVHMGYDLIFNPAETKFMSLVRENGGRAFNGLKMLLYQGIIAHELWTGTKIDSELAEAAYGAMKKAMGIQ